MAVEAAPPVVGMGPAVGDRVVEVGGSTTAPGSGQPLPFPNRVLAARNTRTNRRIRDHTTNA